MKKKDKLTFSKKMVIAILSVSLIDMQLPFILAFLGKPEIAETLAITIVTEIIGTVVTYSAKAFLENKEQEKIKFEKEKINDGLVPVEIEEAKG